MSAASAATLHPLQSLLLDAVSRALDAKADPSGHLDEDTQAELDAIAEKAEQVGGVTLALDEDAEPDSPDAADAEVEAVIDEAVGRFAGLSRRLRRALLAAIASGPTWQALFSARRVLDEHMPEVVAALSDAQMVAALRGMQAVARRLRDANENQPGPQAGEPLPVECPSAPEPAWRPEAVSGTSAGAPSTPTLPLIDAAVADLRRRRLLTRAQFDQLAAEARQAAFTVAGVQSETVLGKVRDALADAVEGGKTLDQFKKDVEVATGEGTFLSPAHAEVVFRNGVQSAYSAGQEKLLEHPVVDELFPYVEYAAIHDDRVRPEHLALESHGIDGTSIYRRDDPVWQMFRPPWSWNCRCAATPLSVADAARKGLREAIEWERSGVAPLHPAHVPMPPFRPSPGFERRELSTDSEGHEHGNDGRFVSKGQGGEGGGGGGASPDQGSNDTTADAKPAPKSAWHEWAGRQDARESRRKTVQQSRELIDDAGKDLGGGIEERPYDLVADAELGKLDASEVKGAVDAANGSLSAWGEKAAAALKEAGTPEGELKRFDREREKFAGYVGNAATVYLERVGKLAEAHAAVKELEEAEPEEPEYEEPDYPEEPVEPPQPEEAEWPEEPDREQFASDEDFDKAWGEWDVVTDKIKTDYETALAQWEKDVDAWEKEHDAWDQKTEKMKEESEAAHEKAVEKWDREHDRWDAKIDRARERLDVAQDRHDAAYDKWRDEWTEAKDYLDDWARTTLDDEDSALDDEESEDEEPDADEGNEGNEDADNPASLSTDAEGHDHAADGKFARKGQGGEKGGEKVGGKGGKPNHSPGHASRHSPRTRLRQLLSHARKLPGAVRRKAVDFARKKYATFAERYGTKGAKAVMASVVLLTPVPVLGSSLVPIALAESVRAMHRLLSRGRKAGKAGAAAPATLAADVTGDAPSLVGGVREFINDFYRHMGEQPPSYSNEQIEKALGAGGATLATDASGHEHKGKGPGGGQFTGKGEAGGSKGTSKAKEKTESHPGAAHGSSVRVKPVKQRAFAGEPVPTKTTLTKQETGRVGEAVAVAWLKSQGYADARPMNSSKTNFPVDMLEDHRPTEVKAGLVSNTRKAQQWRLTFSKESATEKALYEKMTPEQRKEWNAEKQARIHERKKAVIAALEKETGQKISPRTLTLIVNPDTRTADVYEFDGLHDRIDWQSEAAKKAYKGSVKYEHPG